MARAGTYTSHITFHSEADAGATWTNMPAAATFLFNSHRHVIGVDLTGMTAIRLRVNKQATAGNAGAKLILRYSPTFSTSVSSYSDVGVSEVSVAIDTTNAYLDSGYIDISPDAMVYGEIFLAIVGSGGNGTLDPQFGTISVALV